MIDTTKLYDLHINEVKIQRSAARGFMPFICSVIDDIQRTQPITRYLELGMSGGGSHRRYAEASSNIEIFAVERFHPDMTEIPTYPREIMVYQNAQSTLMEYPNIKCLYGTNAYDHDTPEKLSKISGHNSYDLINDDAATDWPRMRNSLNVWRNSVAEHGAYITEVPDGMGVERWWNMSREQHIENFNELAKDGLVVFDLEEYKHIVPGFEQDWNAHFIGFWAPNWKNFKSTLAKFQHNIVAGEVNLS